MTRIRPPSSATTKTVPQFSARSYDGALAREGEPSDGTLLLSGFQVRSDGPELLDQHKLTPGCP
jgi:hypothetical protein